MKKIVLLICLGSVPVFTTAQIIPGVSEAKYWPLPGKFASQLAESKQGIERINLLISFTQYYLNYYGKGDSASYYLAQAEQLNQSLNVDSLKTRIEILSAYRYCDTAHPMNPKDIFLPLVNKSREAHNKVNELLAWGYLRLYFPHADTSKSFLLECCSRIASLAGYIGHIDDSLYMVHFIADIHLQQNKYYQAEQELLAIIPAQEQIKAHNVMLSYDLLTAVYIKKGEFNKALEYGLKAQNAMRISEDTAFAFTFYNRLSKIYRVLGDYTSSLEWQKKVLANRIGEHSAEYLYSTGSNIVMLLILLKRPEEARQFMERMFASYMPANNRERLFKSKMLGDVNMAFGNNSLAEKAYLEMIKYTEAGADGSYRNFYYSAIANFYFKTSKFIQAKQYWMQALEQGQKEGLTDQLKDIQMNLFQADSALGDYKSAITHLQVNNKLKDSIFNATKNRQFEELQIAYQVSEQKNDLTQLRDKEKLQQAQLAKTRNTRNWVLAGSVMILIIAGLLFRQGQLRKKANAEISQKNALLQQMVTEKEWLLKEVHHRVKNNLHTVICLLESQAMYLQDDALKAIENSQHRIYAMSLIHQKLYQTEDVQAIDMKNYVTEFLQYLEDSFGAPSNIHILASIEQIKLGITQAIPVGLIINEAVTNCFKYAFPDNRIGQVAIGLGLRNDDIVLQVVDNGIGFNLEGNAPKRETLGIELIKGLTKDLKGTVDFIDNNGTAITIQFRPEAIHV